jgi:hypothetical protein
MLEEVVCLFQWISGWFRDSVIGVVQTPVNPLKDAIFLGGRSLSEKAPPKFYFALHKAKGVSINSPVSCRASSK